jgi:MFS family permease
VSTGKAAEPQTDWRGVAFGLALGVLAAYQQFKLPPVLPLLLGRYAYGRTLAGSLMSIYAAAGLLLSVPAGRILVRRGPRGLLVTAFALFVTGNLLALAVPASGAAMLGSRLLEGLGFAIAAVVGAVVTVSSASLRHRPVAVALWSTWIPAGQVIGTLLAIPSVSLGQWQPLWWASFLSTLALAAWGHRLRAAGSPALASPEPGPTRGAAAPLAEQDRRGPLLVAAILFGLWSGQYITYVTWLPQYLVEAHGFAPGAAARAYLIPSVLVIVFNLIAGALLHAGARLSLLLPGSIAVQAAVWLLVPFTRSTAQGLASLAAYGVSAGITATCIFALPGALFGAAASRGFAALMAGRNVGVLIGPVLLAQAVAVAGTWRPVPPLFGGLCLGTFLTAVYLCRRIAALKEASGQRSLVS